MGRKNTKRPKGNTKEKSDTFRFEEKGNKMGWALRERRKKVKFSKSQSEFLLDVYNEGERSGKKKDPTSVVELMKLATKDAIKPFTPQEYIRKEQISAYFSRLTIQRRKGKARRVYQIKTKMDSRRAMMMKSMHAWMKKVTRVKTKILTVKTMTNLKILTNLMMMVMKVTVI